MSLLVAITGDELAIRQLHRAAGTLGAMLRLVSGVELEALPEPPSGVVLDLDQGEFLPVLSRLRGRWPGVLVVGFLALPDADRWRSALDGGCDFVTTRGGLGRLLSDRVPEYQSRPGGSRVRLFALGDVAGRVGLVKQLDDTPFGPVAVYHLGGKILAVSDRCPHAGARLSEGELAGDEPVITCPRHGSRFALTDGERVRGPADDPLPTFRVVVEGTEVFLRLG